jgi:hypothetical protein
MFTPKAFYMDNVDYLNISDFHSVDVAVHALRIPVKYRFLKAMRRETR